MTYEERINHVRRYRHHYPYTIRTSLKGGLSPVQLQEELPDVKFVRVPFPSKRFVLWMFEAPEDAALAHALV